MNLIQLNHSASEELIKIRQRIGLDLITVGGYPRSCLTKESFNDIDVWIKGAKHSILFSEFLRSTKFPFSFYQIVEGNGLLHPFETTDVVHNQIYIKFSEDDPEGRFVHYSDDTLKCIMNKILKLSDYGFEYLLRTEYDVDRFRGFLLHLGKNIRRGYTWEPASKEQFMANVERILAILKLQNPFYEEMVRKDLVTRMDIHDFSL